MIPYASQQMMQMQPYHPIQQKAQAYAMPSQQMQMQPYTQQQLYAPPHALNNQETVIKTITIRRAKLPAMQVVMQLVMQQQPPSLTLRREFSSLTPTCFNSSQRMLVAMKTSFVCVMKKERSLCHPTKHHIKRVECIWR